ncbi:MAG: putative oxidoreductase, aryl-alcohol dehydrogenase like protein [Ilumatobacteraceae bacterium]|nr:putative oxidoreductase, aryl-alcohol dehydrogenase like protein [Ilumatobacteraceae bacterium]
MEAVSLGMTDLKVSPIAFGAWELGGEWGSFAADEAVTAIRRARSLGINLFDTAQGYGFGASERLLAEALRKDLDHARAEVVIATKGGLRNTADGLVRDSSPAWLRQGVDESLGALGVDHLDLYQIHWPDPTVPFAETAGALEELVAAGKIRHVGVSNFDAHQITEFARTRPVETLQPPYHLFRQDAARELLPFCLQQGIGVLAYAPLAHGLLSGGLREDVTFAPEDWRSASPVFHGEPFMRNLEAVGALQSIAAGLGATVSQLAVAWVLDNPAVDVAIVGTRNAEHIAEAVAAADLRLSATDRSRIDAVMAHAVPVGGPSPEAMP